MILIIALVLVSAIVFAIGGLTKEQKDFYNTCKKNCSTSKMTEKRLCNTVSFECGKACHGNRTNVTDQSQIEYDNCTSECVSLIPENATIAEANKLKRECKSNCSAAVKSARSLANSGFRDCKQACQDTKQACKKSANEIAWACSDNCSVSALAYSPEGDNSSESNSTASNAKIRCESPRPEECTQEEDPVCSNRKDGYANACLACADAQVRWYREGSC